MCIFHFKDKPRKRAHRYCVLKTSLAKGTEEKNVFLSPLKKIRIEFNKEQIAREAYPETNDIFPPYGPGFHVFTKEFDAVEYAVKGEVVALCLVKERIGIGMVDGKKAEVWKRKKVIKILGKKHASSGIYIRL